MQIPYLVLGITDDADDADIRRRYLELVKKYPPESAPVRFQQITEAYEAVRTRRKRIAAKLFGTAHTAGDYTGQLALLAEAVPIRRRRVGLQALFEVEKQCLKK